MCYISNSLKYYEEKQDKEETQGVLRQGQHGFSRWSYRVNETTQQKYREKEVRHMDIQEKRLQAEGTEVQRP